MNKWKLMKKWMIKKLNINNPIISCNIPEGNDDDVLVMSSVEQGGHSTDCVVNSGHCVTSVGQAGHVHINISSVVTSGHVCTGHSVAISVVQGRYTVVGSVGHVKTSVVPAGKMIFWIPFFLDLQMAARLMQVLL